MRSSWSLAPIALAAACLAEADDRPVSWSYIHPAIIVPNCARSGCHSDFSRTAGINLQYPDQARDLFVSQTIDTPVLRGQQAGVPRMPPDQPLPTADIELIQRWIDEGMADN